MKAGVVVAEFVETERHRPPVDSCVATLCAAAVNPVQIIALAGSATENAHPAVATWRTAERHDNRFVWRIAILVCRYRLCSH
jgi:hypothetical protein